MAFRPAFAVTLVVVTVTFPVARDMVPLAAALLPAVRAPGIARPAVNIAALDPHVALALPAPVARSPHVAHLRRGRRRFVDDGGRRRDGRADVDAHAHLRQG